LPVRPEKVLDGKTVRAAWPAGTEGEPGGERARGLGTGRFKRLPGVTATTSERRRVAGL